MIESRAHRCPDIIGSDRERVDNNFINPPEGKLPKAQQQWKTQYLMKYNKIKSTNENKNINAKRQREKTGQTKQKIKPI